MRYFISLLFIAMFSYAEAATDSTQLQKTSAADHKYTLLNFSGSDWCIPCIKMKKAIFLTDTFKSYSSEHLVWLNADFPRDKKKLSSDQLKKNEQLAEKYNRKGAFPYTVLLDENGKVIKSWDGFPNLTAEQFIQQVDAAIQHDEDSHHT